MKSIREIYKIGKGPSSSHTIGPERAAKKLKKRYPDADHYEVRLYESLCKTGKGHGTDRVLYEVLNPVSTDVIFCEESPEDITHPNTMDLFAYKEEQVIGSMRVISVGGGDIHVAGEAKAEQEEYYPENTFAEVEQFCRFRNLDLAEYVEFNEGEEIWEYLEKIWRVMKHSVEEGLSVSGYLPGVLHIERKAKLLFENKSKGGSPEIEECRLISAYAYAVSEQNADCGTIVTAPTCGACGIVPALLYYLQQREGYSDEEIIKGLAVAGLFGNLIKQNASISGAECGCQAEVGAACSMAAAAATYLSGLSINKVQYAAEIALEHHLGLTCDPICGLVQVPCIERNAVAALRALNSSRLAYFLSGTQRISFDIVVKTMYETGISMNKRFKETAEGGLAKMFERRRK